MTDSAYDNALKRRKALQEAVQSKLKELEEIEVWIRMHRQLAAGPDEQKQEIAEVALSRLGWGKTQETFEQFAKTILRDVGRPMQSGEFVEEFRKRGHPIGGLNETKQAWNKLWTAKKRGALTHLPKLGYWLPDEPLSTVAADTAREAAVMQRQKARTGERAGGRHRATGKPVGRPPTVSDERIEQAKQWIAQGKTLKEAAHLLGMSAGGLSGRIRKLAKKPKPAT